MFYKKRNIQLFKGEPVEIYSQNKILNFKMSSWSIRYTFLVIIIKLYVLSYQKNKTFFSYNVSDYYSEGYIVDLDTSHTVGIQIRKVFAYQMYIHSFNIFI